jgi:inner membrane protein involved in colicin E2 resistance
MILRIVAIAFIYFCTSAAWALLGTTVFTRTHQLDNKLKGEVGQLWGQPQRQVEPKVIAAYNQEKQKTKVQNGIAIVETEIEKVRVPLNLGGSDLKAHVQLSHRQKGLLWYSTYQVQFAGTYLVTNTSGRDGDVSFELDFPAGSAVYDDFQLKLGETLVPDLAVQKEGFVHTFFMKAGASERVTVQYRTQGQDQWGYGFSNEVSQVKNFRLAVTTDFQDIDFPGNTISPTAKTQGEKGWELVWSFSNLLTGAEIGVEMPKKLNPGPWVSQVSFAAPVSLFLFFFLLFIFTTIRGIPLHPMNYFFVAAAFFSFHLLLAYLVDHLSIHLAFLIASVVSIVLVTSYMRLVVGNRFAFREIGLAQFVYLVLFSYTYFFEGFTGLAITILAVSTLFIVMQVSGRVNWEVMFRRPSPQPAFTFEPEATPASSTESR